MYRIEKKRGQVRVFDAMNLKCIYSAPEDSYLVYESTEASSVQVGIVGTMPDVQLLTALAGVLKLKAQ